MLGLWSSHSSSVMCHGVMQCRLERRTMRMTRGRRLIARPVLWMIFTLVVKQSVFQMCGCMNCAQKLWIPVVMLVPLRPQLATSELWKSFCLSECVGLLGVCLCHSYLTDFRSHSSCRMNILLNILGQFLRAQSSRRVSYV